MPTLPGSEDRADERLLLSVLDQSPIAEGSTGGGRAPQFDRPRALGRRARLSPLLGGRAPWHADAGLREPRGADRPDRGRDLAPAGGERRRHAAALQPAQGRGDVQHAERPLSRADRPRPRPRAGERPDDRDRAAARPPPPSRPTTSRSSSPSCWPISAAPCRRTTPSPAWRRPCRAGLSVPSRGCSARRRRAGSGRRRSGCPTRSPTSSSRREPRSPPATARSFSRREWLGGAARGRRRLGALRRDRRRGRAAGRQLPHGDRSSVPWASGSGAAGRDGAALPRRAGGLPLRRPDGA